MNHKAPIYEFQYAFLIQIINGYITRVYVSLFPYHYHMQARTRNRPSAPPI